MGVPSHDWFSSGSEPKHNESSSLVRSSNNMVEIEDEHESGPTDCLERPLRKLYYRYAHFVALRPLPFVLIPLLLTGLCVPGIFLRSINGEINVVNLYTPEGGDSFREQQAIVEKWPVGDKKYFPNRISSELRQSQVIVTPKNLSESILDDPYSDQVYTLNLFITNQIAVFQDGKKYNYFDLCMRDYYGNCYVNQIMMILHKMKQIKSDALKEWLGDDIFDVTYPWIENGGKKYYIASTLNDVTLYNGTNLVKSAKAWLLLYQLRYNPENISRLSGQWEEEFERAMINYRSDDIKISFMHSESLNREAEKNAVVTVGLIGACVVVIVVLVLLFGTVTAPLYLTSFPTIDWVLSNHFLSVMGVVTAGMGSVTSIGLLVYLSWFTRKTSFASVVYCMPFLNLSIGVDNMFLLVAAWRRTSAMKTVPERLAHAASDAGVSIAITAITDSLSFAIGCITSLRSVYIFCLYTAVAIVATFLYQLTFLLGMMTYAGRLEKNGRHNIIFTRVIQFDKAESVGIFDRLFNLGTVYKRDQSVPARRSKSAEFFENWYAPILMSDHVRVLALSWMGMYLIASIYGCIGIKQGLEPKRILLADSYAQDHYHNLLNYVWTYGMEVQVVVNNPPDFRVPNSTTEAWRIANSFLNTKHTLGPESLQFWLEDYEHEAHRMGFGHILENKTINYNFLRDDFFSKPEYVEWFNDVVIGNNSKTGLPEITAYRFIIATKNFNHAELQRQTYNLLRKIAAGDSLARYNITTYYPLWHFAEQYNMVLGNLLQNMAIATVAMVIISLLLIPHPLSAVWVGISIISIDLGVIGFGAFWGLRIDIITTITIIMSIGFSVDFSAHVCYHYIVSQADTPEGKVREALGVVGWPIVQGAVSTLVGVSVISMTDAYLVQAFFRTVFLVISIGALHGLVFIPVLLSLVVRGPCINKCKKAKISE